uniref:FA_desaturase domain-containing protein n=1 Tax=Macrostomum lignano TaxID=282301 RepID=A0A1I8JRA2_9PLAT
AGWAQHDYGHLSVFNSRRLNHIGHELVVGHLKGASSHWWNFPSLSASFESRITTTSGCWTPDAAAAVLPLRERVLYAETTKNLRDLMWTVSFFAKFFYVFNHFFSSWWGTFALYMFTRLFPTMPRHSYPLVQPHVKRICSKHGIPYVEKPLGTAFADIIRSLKKSGEL